MLALEQGWQPTERELKEFRIFDVDKQVIPSFEIIGKKYMQHIPLAEASQHLPDLIEAALSGEEIIIIKDNQPVVKLTPISPIQHRRQLGSAKGLITISDDFDAPLEEFKEYME